jgi:hypothetical protein
LRKQILYSITRLSPMSLFNSKGTFLLAERNRIGRSNGPSTPLQLEDRITLSYSSNSQIKSQHIFIVLCVNRRVE